MKFRLELYFYWRINYLNMIQINSHFIFNTKYYFDSLLVVNLLEEDKHKRSREFSTAYTLKVIYA